jgi:ABC-type nitrate/sulfonate/bicarbonate transport system substrate-binding protein
MEQRWGWVRKPRNSVTVVFIHGFRSSAVGAWQRPDGTFWPKIFCDDVNLKEYGVYLFDYRTEITSGTYSIDHVVAMLQARLGIDKVLDGEQSGGALIFVCHSMGGIVARRYIVIQQMELLKKPLGLFLLATPSIGSTYANFINAVLPFNNAQLTTLTTGENNQWLTALDSQFMSLKDGKHLKISGKELSEDTLLGTGLLSRFKLVPRWAAQRYFPDPVTVPYSDHSNICKPQSTQSIQHELLSEFVHKCAESHSNHTAAELSSLGDNPVLIDWPPTPPRPDPVRRAAVAALGIGVGVGVPAYGALGVYRWAKTPSKTTIRIGMKPFVGYAPLFIAQRMNLCKGLTLKFSKVPLQTSMMSGVQTREFEIGMWLACNHAVYRSAVVRANEGVSTGSRSRLANAKVVLKLDESYLGDVVFVRGTGRMEDFKGNIALQREDAGEYLVRSLCQEQGFNYNSLRDRVFDLQPKEAAADFLAGKYNMVTTYSPHVDAIIDQAKIKDSNLKQVWSASDTKFKSIVDVLAVEEEFLIRNEDAVRSLMNGWYAAVKLLAERNAEAISFAIDGLNSLGEKYDPNTMFADLDPNILKLSDRKDNRDYFKPEKISSAFMLHYEDGMRTFDPIRYVPFDEHAIAEKFHGLE